VLTAWDLQAITGPRPTGLGYSVRLLLDAYTQYGGVEGRPAEVLGLPPNAHDRALRGVPDRVLWEQWRLPAAVAKLAPPTALLYCPALGAPRRCALPRVAHVHDLIPLADPTQFKGAARWYWTQYLPQCWRTCSALTVSNASLVDEAEQRLGFRREQIHIVPYYCGLGADEIATAQASSPPVATPYFMMLASHEPRKNIVLALNALALLKERKLQPRLVCLGTRTVYTLPLRQLAQRLGVGDQVTWPDYAPRALVLQLLQHSAGLLFVSRHEGYGMPPQEAQALGTPVVLSDIACHRTVYADPARWSKVPEELRTPPPFVGVADDAALADQMQRLLEDGAWAAQLRAAGQAYQQTFSPQATAQALRRAFEAVL
jgi:glycosyltransferase involved in cell wall biosynthesis